LIEIRRTLYGFRRDVVLAGYAFSCSLRPFNGVTLAPFSITFHLIFGTGTPFDPLFQFVLVAHNQLELIYADRDALAERGLFGVYTAARDLIKL